MNADQRAVGEDIYETPSEARTEVVEQVFGRTTFLLIFVMLLALVVGIGFAVYALSMA